MVDRDRFLDMTVLPPKDANEACERIAESLGGTLLTRPADIPIEPGFDHNESVQYDRVSSGIDVTAFYDSCRLTPEGFPKNVSKGIGDIENILAFEDLMGAMSATHLAKLSNCDEASRARPFDWKSADPYDPQAVLAAVAEELGLKVIDTAAPLPLRQAWKELVVDTAKHVRDVAYEYFRDKL